MMSNCDIMQCTKIHLDLLRCQTYWSVTSIYSTLLASQTNCFHAPSAVTCVLSQLVLHLDFDPSLKTQTDARSGHTGNNFELQSKMLQLL